MRVYLLSSCEALRSLQRRVEDIEREERTVGSTAEGLRKVKAGLFGALAAVRASVPAITQEPEPSQAARPCEIMTRVCDFFRDAGKWPTQWKDIGLKRDSALVRAGKSFRRGEHGPPVNGRQRSPRKRTPQQRN
jgi:hypothetical protein